MYFVNHDAPIPSNIVEPDDLRTYCSGDLSSLSPRERARVRRTSRWAKIVRIFTDKNNPDLIKFSSLYSDGDMQTRVYNKEYCWYVDNLLGAKYEKKTEEPAPEIKIPEGLWGLTDKSDVEHFPTVQGKDLKAGMVVLLASQTRRDQNIDNCRWIRLTETPNWESQDILHRIRGVYANGVRAAYFISPLNSFYVYDPQNETYIASFRGCDRPAMYLRASSLVEAAEKVSAMCTEEEVRDVVLRKKFVV